MTELTPQTKTVFQPTISRRVSNISLEQEATLALQGAQSRLAKAKRELADFVSEHGAVVGSPDERQSLERERHALEIEADDAARQVTKATEDLEAFARFP